MHSLPEAGIGSDRVHLIVIEHSRLSLSCKYSSLFDAVTVPDAVSVPDVVNCNLRNTDAVLNRRHELDKSVHAYDCTAAYIR